MRELGFASVMDGVTLLSVVGADSKPPYVELKPAIIPGSRWRFGHPRADHDGAEPQMRRPSPRLSQTGARIPNTLWKT